MTTLDSTNSSRQGTSEPRLIRWFKSRLLAQLDDFHGGTLVLWENGMRRQLGQGGPLGVMLCIHRACAWQRLALGGTVGAAWTATGTRMIWWR